MRLSVLVMSVFFCVSAAFADTYPEKPLTIVCWSSAGSGHDLMARMFAKVGEKYLGQPMAVLNKNGAQGKIAMNYVLNKEPDGYTIMTNTRSMTQILTETDEKLNIHSFKYVCRLVADPFVILVRDDSPFNTLDELIDYAANNPKKIKMGGYSVQSVDEMLVNKFMRLTGTEMRYVPYKGGMEPVVAVLGNHIDVALANPSEMIANYQTGKLKVLATASEERFEPFEDIPTLKEKGINIVEEHWRGVMASGEVSDEAIEKLDSTCRQVAHDPEFKKFMKSVNMLNGYVPSGKFTTLVEEQTRENHK